MSEWLHSIVQNIIDFAGAHPSLVGIVLLFFAGGEAVVVVGALLPGESIVFGLAAAAGAAGVNPWVMVLWVTLGAAFGDGISFWMGHKYGHSVVNWPWIRSRPQLLEKGEKFIERQGIKSIVIARFLPGLRAVVPVAAGILGMDSKRFFVANIISAFSWAVLHVFPAVALGIAYKTLGEISGRIAVILLISLLAVIILLYLMRLIIIWVVPHIAQLLTFAIDTLSSSTNYYSLALARMLDPKRRGFAGSVLWSLILLAAVAGSLGILEDLVSGDPLVRADVAINHFVQGLRSEPVDRFMVLVTSLGGTLPLASVSIAMIGFLLLQRAWRPAFAALGVITTARIFAPLVKFILHKPRPIQIYSGAEAYSFPSGHTTMSAVVFGILAVLVSRGLATGGKIAVFSLLALWVGLIGASRIYLSAHWPSDVIGGILFGTVFIATFALLNNQTQLRKDSSFGLATSALVVFSVVGSYYAATSFSKNLVQYAPRVSMEKMVIADWTGGKWQTLPTRRIDLGGEREEKFIIQWVGKKPGIILAMEKNGWRKTNPFSWADGLGFIKPGVKLNDITPLPILHNGRFPAVTLIKAINNNGSSKGRLVFRFWRADIDIMGSAGITPLFLGSVKTETLKKPIPWVTIMQENNAAADIKSSLASVLGKMKNLKFYQTSGRGPLLIAPKQ